MKKHIHGFFCRQWHHHKDLLLDGKVNVWDEIYIENDGNGISGKYDRIHAKRDDGSYSVFPAHHCHSILISGAVENDNSPSTAE